MDWVRCREGWGTWLGKMCLALLASSGKPLFPHFFRISSLNQVLNAISIASKTGYLIVSLPDSTTNRGRSHFHFPSSLDLNLCAHNETLRFLLNHFLCQDFLSIAHCTEIEKGWGRDASLNHVLDRVDLLKYATSVCLYAGKQTVTHKWVNRMRR